MISRVLERKKILIIDDDAQICQLIRLIFQNVGIAIVSANNGTLALQRIDEDKPDLILLDIMMPSMNGWLVLAQIRERSIIPIIILSGLTQEKDIVRGLQDGADDYIVKPFSSQMLLAHVEAVLRRNALAIPAKTDFFAWYDDYLVVNLHSCQVFINGQRVNLSPIEFELLAYLVQHAGETCTFAQILANVWKDKNFYHTEYIHVYVSRLRQKLEKDPKKPVYLHGQYGVGYSFAKQLAVTPILPPFQD